MITLLLIGLSLFAFFGAYIFKDKHFSDSLYDSVTCFGSAVILVVVLFDFLPHQLEDFMPSLEHHHHGNTHHTGHHHTTNESLLPYLFFLLLVVGGFVFQWFVEKIFHVKLSSKFENGMLVLGMFLHSFSEVAVLFDSFSNLDKSLFWAILCHKIPISFMLAYTLLSTSSLRASILGYSFFIAAIPLGMLCNEYVASIPHIFNIMAIFISGVMLHVFWHLLESIKERNKWSYGLFIVGCFLGYGITLFHAH